jgi:hypothetical protein
MMILKATLILDGYESDAWKTSKLLDLILKKLIRFYYYLWKIVPYLHEFRLREFLILTIWQICQFKFNFNGWSFSWHSLPLRSIKTCHVYQKPCHHATYALPPSPHKRGQPHPGSVEVEGGSCNHSTPEGWVVQPPQQWG